MVQVDDRSGEVILGNVQLFEARKHYTLGETTSSRQVFR